MKINIQMRRLDAILFVATLAVASGLEVYAGPTNQQQQQQQQQQRQPTAAGSLSTLSVQSQSPAPFAAPKLNSTTPRPTNGNQVNSASASAAAAMAAVLESLGRNSAGREGLLSQASASNRIRPQDGGPSASANSHSTFLNGDTELDMYRGKNPFADDSLWRIPIHLEREPSVNSQIGGDNMAKAATSHRVNEYDALMAGGKNDANNVDGGGDDDDDDDASPASAFADANLSKSASSAPTVISASTDLKTAAGYHHSTHGGHHNYAGDHHSPHYNSHGADHGHYGADKHYGKYFQYASVPYPYTWDFGYRRGNPYHTIERYEHGKGPHFQTKVKWNDKKYGGYGVHVWDYNHDDHYSNHHGKHYDSHAPSHYDAGNQHGSAYYGAGHHGHGYH